MAEPTNDAVSDERLREIIAGCDKAAPGPWFAGSAEAGLCTVDNGTDAMWPIKCEWHEGKHIANCDPETIRYLATAELNRRSVTSQASEGEVAGWFWRWAISDEWRPLSRSRTEAGRADFVRDQEKIAPVVVAQLYIASPSKRVVETGWLIEINNRSTGPTWFSMGETEDDGGHFTKDSLKALRFGRKEDAQAYIDDIGWTEAIPTEHEWSDPPQALQGGRS